MKQLFGFQRVELDPKQSATLFFDAGVEVFKTVDEEVTKLLTHELQYVIIHIILPQGNKMLKPGEYTVRIEDLSHTITLF